MFNLGFAYEEGQGVPKDSKRAMELFEAAAAQGHAGACSKLGLAEPSHGSKPSSGGVWKIALAEQLRAKGLDELARKVEVGTFLSLI